MSCIRVTDTDTTSVPKSVGLLRVAIFTHPECVANAINGNAETHDGWSSRVVLTCTLWREINRVDVARYSTRFPSVEFSPRALSMRAIYLFKKCTILALVIHLEFIASVIECRHQLCFYSREIFFLRISEKIVQNSTQI
jgi:hypothetical protein